MLVIVVVEVAVVLVTVVLIVAMLNDIFIYFPFISSMGVYKFPAFVVAMTGKTNLKATDKTFGSDSYSAYFRLIHMHAYVHICTPSTRTQSPPPLSRCDFSVSLSHTQTLTHALTQHSRARTHAQWQ